MTSPLNLDLIGMAAAVLERCRSGGHRVVTAESCTGGLVAACLTAVAGSSDVVERGFVTYSNEAKTELLGIPDRHIQDHGAVSEPIARAMATGALEKARADLSVSITGVAGPGGATADKPVGLVHLAAARSDGTVLHESHLFSGDRSAVREASVAAALTLLTRIADAQP